jgi:NAD+ kinase
LKTIALFGQRVEKDARPYVEVFLEELERLNITIWFFDVFIRENIGQMELPRNRHTWNSHEELKKIAPDALITLGGDGTILRAVTFVRDSNIPILGINTGRLGFLANVARHESKAVVNDLINGNYHINERKLLDVQVDNGCCPPLPFALNEVTVARKDSTSMVTVHTWINNEFLSSYWADGIIIATPTGSTGYSLSCGGPIIMPGSETFVITPISPHNLNVRPFVIPNHYNIKLRIEAREPMFLTSLDSRIHSMPIETEIYIKRADFTVKIIETEQQKFTKTLREKLFWGKDIRN